MKNTDLQNYLYNDFQKFANKASFVIDSRSFFTSVHMSEKSIVAFYQFLCDLIANGKESIFSDPQDAQHLSPDQVQNIQNDLAGLIQVLGNDCETIHSFIQCAEPDLPFQDLRNMLIEYLEIQSVLKKKMVSFLEFFKAQYLNARFRTMFILWSPYTVQEGLRQLNDITDELRKIMGVLETILPIIQTL